MPESNAEYTCTYLQEISYTGRIQFADEVETVRLEAEKLNEQGIDIIIVLSHNGLDIHRWGDFLQLSIILSVKDKLFYELESKKNVIKGVCNLNKIKQYQENVKFRK